MLLSPPLSLTNDNHFVSLVFEWTIPTERLPLVGEVSAKYRPSDCLLSAKLVLTFADRGCHMVSVTDPYGRVLGFLDQTRYVFFQVDPQLYSRGWVNPVPDLLLLRKSGSAGNRAQTSGSVATRPQMRSLFVNYNIKICILVFFVRICEIGQMIKINKPICT
jgi:hypothetical protein